MRRTVLAALAALLAGCATSPEITAWNMAREANTPAAYQDFLRRHPESGHADEARERIGTSKKEKMLSASTVDECVRAMKGDPDPGTAAAVAELAAKAAMKEDSAEPLHAFLVHFPGSGSAGAVRGRLEEVEFRSASADPSPRAMEYFLLRFPGSRFSAEGRSLLREKSYEQVRAWGSRPGYRGFLLRFPEGPRAEEVRGWIGDVPVPQGTRLPPGEAAPSPEAIPWVKAYGCALALSAEIAKGGEGQDSLRKALFDLERGSAPGGLPAACASASLPSAGGGGEEFAAALKAVSRVEERKKALAAQWKGYAQREEMARNAAAASGKVGDELEAAELSEDVLGSGPLGGLDVGKEKGSASARKALERFRAAGEAIGRDKAEAKRLLAEADGLSRPLQYYVTGALAGDRFSGGGR